MAAAAHLVAKATDVLLGWSLYIVALIPGIVLLIPSYLVFEPTVPKLLVFCDTGLVGYMAIHALLMISFDLGLLFAAWTPGC